MNGVYIRELPIEELTELMKPYLRNAGLPIEMYEDAWYRRLAEITQERLTKLSNIVGLSDFFFHRVQYEPQAVQKVLKKEGAPETLEKVMEILSDNALEFYSYEIEKRLRGLVEEVGLKAKMVFQPIRVAITGRTVSPPLFETIELLGREATLERLGEALHLIELADG
jgi:glutamyl-tRNA synthetase